ncbi:FABP1 [Ramazzottius varieornatus]|uniref:FABP1 n=1 Tax=Ramazzottius varieornatus TaxID=947166 RepID=A0A1D1WAU7_RAMVA|nr:FABP1 [Ramazzottius varieornatus]
MERKTASHNWSGVYKHESDDNLEAYERARAQQLTEEQLKVILDQHPVVEIRQDGDNFYMKTTLNFRPVQELKFTLGHEWFTTTPDGRKISNVFLVDGNRLIQRQTDEQENFIEYIREFKNDKMYLELRRGPVVARRCFKKVPGL